MMVQRKSSSYGSSVLYVHYHSHYNKVMLMCIGWVLHVHVLLHPTIIMAQQFVLFVVMLSLPASQQQLALAVVAVVLAVSAAVVVHMAMDIALAFAARTQLDLV